MKARASSDFAFLSIALDADGELPSEFVIFRAGLNKTTKGDVTFDEKAAKVVMADVVERGVEYPVDYEHQSLNPLMLMPAEQGEAAGWFKAELRDGSLWASSVEWTERGAAKIKGKGFRYISPAVDLSKSKDGTMRPSRLINCALTNTPALHNPAALFSAREEFSMSGWVPMCLGRSISSNSLCCQACEHKVICASLCYGSSVPGDPDPDKMKAADMQMSAREAGAAWEKSIADKAITAAKEQHMKQILTTLSLGEAASEGDAVTAITSLQAGVSALLALTGKSTVAEATGVFSAWKQDAEKVPALAARVQEIEEKAQADKVEALILSAKTDKRLTPADEPKAREFLKAHGFAAFSAYVEMLHPVVTAPAKDPEAKPPAVTSAQAEIAKTLGVDPNPPAAK